MKGRIVALALSAAVAARALAVAAPGEDLLARAEARIGKGDYRGAVELLTGADAPELAPADRGHLRERLATALYELGRHEEALATAGRAAADATAAGDDELHARLALVRGSVARNRGHQLDAIAEYERALALAERLGLRPLAARALVLLASSHQELGDWERVLELAERAFTAEEAPPDAARFRYLIQRGIAHYELADGELARRSFAAGLEIARRLGDLRGESLAEGELGMTAWEFDRDREEALAAYERAIALARRIGVPLLESTWLLNAGNVLRDTGDGAGAAERYRGALAVAERVGLERQRTVAAKNLGQVLVAAGELDAAEPLLARALADAERLQVPKIRWQARMELGDLHRARGDRKRARELYEASLEVLEAQNAGVLLEQFRSDLLGSALAQYDPYERLVDLLASGGERDAAFLVAERGRARVFLHRLAAVRAAIAEEVAPEYVRAEQEVLERIVAAQAELRRPELAAEERRARLAAVESAEEELALLRVRLARERPAVAHARYPELPGLAALRRDALAPGEALVSYFLGRARSWAWVASARGVELAELAPRAELEALVERALAALREPGARRAEVALRAAGEALLAPLASALTAGAHLVVVPHGVLHYLPFEALRGPDGRYLVERHTVAYAPSAASFAFLRAHAPGEVRLARVLAVGNPLVPAPGAATQREAPLALLGHLRALPHSGAELRAIARRFGRAARVLEGAAATEGALARAPLAEIDLLHFATHALVDERRPERSGLALTPEPPDDGLLQVREIYRLPLAAALVTLSACETALGRDVAGEGIVGLTRAFFHAGAGAVAATLWSVDDAAAAALMDRFYREVGRGVPLHAALAEAKRALLAAGGATAHPYYWAPYVLVGESATRVRTPRRARVAAWALAGLVVVAALGTLIARRRRAATPTR
jgi:CHAT domain-containing protein/predicted negative regulator of RcsB-dependent stress response